MLLISLRITVVGLCVRWLFVVCCLCSLLFMLCVVSCLLSVALLSVVLRKRRKKQHHPEGEKRKQHDAISRGRAAPISRREEDKQLYPMRHWPALPPLPCRILWVVQRMCGDGSDLFPRVVSLFHLSSFLTLYPRYLNMTSEKLAAAPPFVCTFRNQGGRKEHLSKGGGVENAAPLKGGRETAAPLKRETTAAPIPPPLLPSTHTHPLTSTRRGGIAPLQRRRKKKALPPQRRSKRSKAPLPKWRKGEQHRSRREKRKATAPQQTLIYNLWKRIEN